MPQFDCLCCHASPSHVGLNQQPSQLAQRHYFMHLEVHPGWMHLMIFICSVCRSLWFVLGSAVLGRALRQSHMDASRSVHLDASRQANWATADPSSRHGPVTHTRCHAACVPWNVALDCCKNAAARMGLLQLQSMPRMGCCGRLELLSAISKMFQVKGNRQLFHSCLAQLKEGKACLSE
jgi:hypothetical protein